MSEERDRRRALGFLRGVADAAAAWIEPFSGGVMLRNPDFPLLWSANRARLEGPWDGSAEELDATLEEVYAGTDLPHRTVITDDPDDARRLKTGLAALGYRREEEVVMALRRAPDRDAPTVAEDVPIGVCATVREAIAGERGGRLTEGLLEQILGYDEHVHRALGDRWLAAFHEGRPSACARVITNAGVGQVEDVATLPSARGKGLATSIVLEGVARLRGEGAALILIVAKSDDWPRRLYGRLGFDDLASLCRFRRAA